jgi:hypothetical protein
MTGAKKKLIEIGDVVPPIACKRACLTTVEADKKECAL